MTLLKELRCPHCNKLLCRHSGSVEVKCSRCKNIVKR
ncbi:Com family DNA-binding transcriptional regulator [Vibrio hepatarius]|nr:Com family DNA-binding transcriptional regulator [Vibrio hepatarius]